MPWMLRAVKALRPLLLTVENVEGLTYRKHRAYLDWFVSELRALGYTVDWRVLNAADYGVPQTRKRLFIVGRVEGAVRWPRATHSRQDGTWVSMAAALGWGMDTPSRTVAGHRGPRWAYANGNSYGTGITLHTFSDQRPDGSWQTRSIDQPVPTITGKSGGQWLLQPGSQADGRRPDKRRRYAVDLEPAPTVMPGKDAAAWVWTRPATTVAGDTRIQPPGHRENRMAPGHKRAGPDAYRLTVAELATLQGFPDGYVFCGNKTSAVKQVGNALPPTMLEAVVGANMWPPRWACL